MLDHVSLARRARTSLAEAGDATLYVEGIGTAGAPGSQCTVSLVRGTRGHPVFHCPPRCALRTAAELGAAAVLIVPVIDGPAGNVVFVGHLAEAGEDAAAVQLSIVRVIVEEAAGEPDEVRRRLVPLELYGVGPALAAAAGHLQAHLNGQHAAALRECAARVSGVAAGHVIGARLEGLDATGTTLAWVDEGGGHRMRLPFGGEARDSRELSVLLRARLDARSG